MFGENSRMSVAELPIAIDREKIAAFCRTRGIRKLSLFGSVLWDDFDPARNDVDVLVAIVGHKMDFNTAEWSSKYFRDEVGREAVSSYEQA